MAALQQVLELVERFDRNRDAYRSSQYHETQARHDRMVALVERILALHKQLAAAKTTHAQTVLQRQIDTTDRQIDRLVYELYGLTEEDTRIVETEDSIPRSA